MSNILRKIRCMVCGSSFESTNGERKYCSVKCKREGSARTRYANRKKGLHKRK